MRTAKSIHALLFIEEKPPQPNPVKTSGRSKELISKRDEAFIDRYYYEGKQNSNMMSDKLVAMVASQFFISSYRAYVIIGENLDRLLELKKLNPSAAFFQKKWPHFKW